MPKRSTPPYAPQRAIAVDVDGTLIRNGQPNAQLIRWCEQQKQRGFTLMLWSARGETYARTTATALKCAHLFTVICSKPGYIVDDKGWSWIKYTRVVRDIGTQHE